MISFQAMFSCLMICLSGYALIRVRYWQEVSFLSQRNITNMITKYLIFFQAETSEDSMRFFLFFLCMPYQVFFPCFAGNQVAEKSEKLLFYLYSSNWPEIDTRYKKMLLLFSIKLNRPIIIRFGFIKQLRLRTFTEVWIKYIFGFRITLDKLEYTNEIAGRGYFIQNIRRTSTCAKIGKMDNLYLLQMGRFIVHYLIRNWIERLSIVFT